MCRPNLKSVSALVPEIGLTAIGFWVVGCEPQSWGRRGRRGSGMVPFKERWLVPIGPPYSNCSPIFTRFRDIAAFVLEHTTKPL